MNQDQFKHLKTYKNPFDLDKLLDQLEFDETSSRSRDVSSRTSHNWLADWLPNISFEAFAGFFQLLAWAALAIAIVAVVWFIAKMIMAYEGRGVIKTELAEGQVDQQIIVAPGETAVNQYLARARELAARGEFAQAIMMLVQGAMSDIERRNQIKFRRGLTAYDYLRAVRKNPPRHQALQHILRIYEPIGFGRRVANAEHFQISLTEFEGEFLGANPASES
ncbi:MAG: DUF4129 domain-containing protein [Planctomycetaceae bacterium]